MSCQEEWLEAISSYLDGALPLEEEHRVHAHLRHCEACAQALVDWVPVVQSLRGLPQRAPTRNLWPALESELRQDPRFARRRVLLQLRRPIVGWAAACIVGLVGGAIALRSHPAPSVPVADMNMYWSQHEQYSHDSGVPTLYGPELHAVEASYQLSP